MNRTMTLTIIMLLIANIMFSSVQASAQYQGMGQGHWRIDIVPNGIATAEVWRASGIVDGSRHPWHAYSYPGQFMDEIYAPYAYYGDWMYFDSQGTLNVTLTWVDYFGNLAANPPALTRINEQSTAWWTGITNYPFAIDIMQSDNADDGLGDPYNRSYLHGDSTGGLKRTVSTGSGSVALPRSISVHAEGPFNIWPGYFWGQVSGGVSYSINVIHAHPANFRKVQQDGTGGVLFFEYEWDSDSGDLADLVACKVRENTTYNGNSGTYSAGYFDPIDPPFATGSWHLRNPTLNEAAATSGWAIDTHNYFTFTHPLASGGFTANQQYEFHCDLCMQPGQWSLLGGPYSITRSVYQTGNGWRYSISKDGLTGYLDNP